MPNDINPHEQYLANIINLATAPIKTLCDEGRAFIASPTIDLNATKKAWGHVMWGVLCALLECPECPGMFRNLQDADGQALVCPSCHGVWTRSSERKFKE